MTLRARESQDAATKLGVTIQSIGVHDLIDFASAFASIESGRIDALLTLIDPFTRQNRQRIVDFAMRRRLPAIYEAREFVESGGLISYGPGLFTIQRRVAEYIDKIFRGAKPADPANKARNAHRGDVCGGRRSGVGGAKDGGQGEYAQAKHALDSEPGSRVTSAGAYTATCAVSHPRQEPYAGKPHVRIWAGGVR
jgi:hypothetical protein